MAFKVGLNVLKLGMMRQGTFQKDRVPDATLPRLQGPGGKRGMLILKIIIKV